MTLPNFNATRVGLVVGILLLLSVFATSFTTMMKVADIENALKPVPLTPTPEVTMPVEPTGEVTPSESPTPSLKVTKVPTATDEPEPSVAE